MCSHELSHFSLFISHVRVETPTTIALKEVFNKLMASIPAETEGLKDNLDVATSLIEAAILTDKSFVHKNLTDEHEGGSKRHRSCRSQRNLSESEDDELYRELSPTDARHKIRARDLRERLNSKYQDRSPRRRRDDSYRDHSPQRERDDYYRDRSPRHGRDGYQRDWSPRERSEYYGDSERRRRSPPGIRVGLKPR